MSTSIRKIALFTHDTFGLGHVRRCQHLIREMCRRVPRASVLLITGSPALHALGELPSNADYLKLPTVAFSGPEENRPPHLRLAAKEMTSLRKRLIRSALDAFRPDLFLVDNFPLGSRKELRPALERLRELGVPTALGLRDIVDLPAVVRRTWTREGIYETIDRLYDRVLVYGLREVLDVVEAYGLPVGVADRVRYCGYVTARKPEVRPAAQVSADLGFDGPFVLATVGGGGDGFPLLSAFVRGMRGANLPALVITGPLMPAAEVERLRALAADSRKLVIKRFVADLPSFMAAARVVVTMGGYNTTAELLALGRRALVMPRNWRYGEHARGKDAGVEWEQVLRARALERIGLVETIDPESLDPGALARRVELAYADRTPAPQVSFDVGGAHRAVDHLFSLAAAEVRHDAI